MPGPTDRGTGRRPLALRVAGRLRASILDGDLGPGDALPSERELCGTFGVGRTTVREALRALQAEGLIVAAGPTDPLRVTTPEAFRSGPVVDAVTAVLRLGRATPDELAELRRVLEEAAGAAPEAGDGAPGDVALQLVLAAVRAASIASG